MPDPAHSDYGLIHVETTPEQRAANRRRRADSERNVDFWNEHCRELTERYLHRFLVIYNGGEMRDFEDALSMNDFVRTLPKEQGAAAMRQYVDYAVPYWSYLDTQ